MDYVSGRKGECRGGDGRAGVAVADAIASLLQLGGSGGRKDGTADASAVAELFVGGVHDGIYMHVRDVVAHDLERHGSSSQVMHLPTESVSPKKGLSHAAM